MRSTRRPARPSENSSRSTEGEDEADGQDNGSESGAARKNFFSSALDINNDGSVTIDEIVMNGASIFLSWVDWGLHMAFAVWLYYNYFGTLYSDLAIAALVVAIGVNLLAIVRYVLRHTADPDSSLRERLMDYPENSTLVLVLGTINVEVLIFLSDEATDHTNFRSLGLLTNMFEGIPMLAIQLALVEYELMEWHPLVIVSFAFTLFTLILKSLRSWIIYHTRDIDDDEPELLIGENLTAEDYLSTLAAAGAFALSLVQLIWLQATAALPGVAGTELGGRMRIAFAVLLASLLCLGAGNFALLTRYLRREHWAHSLLWREALLSAAYGFASLFHGGALNAFTQDDRQYHDTKSEAIVAWLCLYGLPCGAVHTAVGLWLACASHACDVRTPSLPGTAFVTIAPCAVVLPLCLYNLCRLIVARSTMRGVKEEEGIYLYDEDDVQLSSLPVGASERLPVAASVWLSLADVGLHISAAEYLRTRHVLGLVAGAAGAAAGRIDGAGFFRWDSVAPLLPLQTPLDFATIAYGVLAASVLANLAACAHFLLRSASESLRATLFALPGTSTLVLIAGCATGEALGCLARERSDLDAARVLSSVGLLVQDVPLLLLLGLRVTYWQRESAIVVLSLALTTAVIALKLSRALVVALARAHADATPPSARDFLAVTRRGDVLSWAVALAHWLACALLAVALGSHASSAAALASGSALSRAAFDSMLVLAVALGGSALANLCLSSSFLNHRRFCHGHVSQHSYTSAAILLGALVDGSFLNCLAQDGLAYRALKRDALLLHVIFCGLPTLGLGAALKFAFRGALGAHVAARARSPLEAATPLLLDLALALSAAVVVWRLYLWSVLTVTWRAAGKGGGAGGAFGGRRGLLAADSADALGGALAADAADDDDELGQQQSGAGARRPFPSLLSLQRRPSAGSGLYAPSTIAASERSAASAHAASSVFPPRLFVHALPCTRQWLLNRYGSLEPPPRKYAAGTGEQEEEGEEAYATEGKGALGGAAESARGARPAHVDARLDVDALSEVAEEEGREAEGGVPEDEEALDGLDGTIANGAFEHSAVFPARGALCARGRTLGGWTQLDGEGAVVGPPGTAGPSGGKAWRLSLPPGAREGARAAVGQCFRTVAGRRYALAFSAASSEVVEPHARALTVQLTGGALGETATGARLASRRVTLSSATVELGGWRAARVEFTAAGPLSTVVFLVRAPAAVAFVGGVACERLDGGDDGVAGAAGEGAEARVATPSLDLSALGRGDAMRETVEGGGGGEPAAGEGGTAAGADPAGVQPTARRTSLTGGGGGFFEGLSSMFTAMTPRGLQGLGGTGTTPPSADVPAPPTGTTTVASATPATANGGGGYGKETPESAGSAGGGARSPRSMFGMSASGNGGTRSHESTDRGTGNGGAAAELGGSAARQRTDLRATVDAGAATDVLDRVTTAIATVPAVCLFDEPADGRATDTTRGIMVSTASLPRTAGGMPPYIFLPAIAVADESMTRARARMMQGQPVSKMVTYAEQAALGLSSEQVERAASREPSAAWKALGDYERRQRSRMA